MFIYGAWFSKCECLVETVVSSILGLYMLFICDSTAAVVLCVLQIMEGKCRGAVDSLPFNSFALCFGC
jgi:hypothetical protein